MSDPLRLSVRRRFSLVIVSAAIAAATGVSPASFAHNVETDGDVGATFHLEPDHNPKSGEPATIWFALTREGGEAIPLSDCDCTLSIVNTQDESQTIDVPTLTAIDVETYTDIPSAEVVFPEAGLYAVKLSGIPSAIAAEPFEAFELSYEVTAQPGAAGDAADKTADKTTEESPAPTAAEDTDQANTMQPNPVVDSWVWLVVSLLMLGAGGVLGMILLGRFVLGVIQKRRGRSPRQSNPSTPGSTAAAKPTDSSPTSAPIGTSASNTSATTPTTTDPQPNPTATTSAIAAEAQTAPEPSTASQASDTVNSADSTNSKTSADSTNPTDAIASIKDWD
ncbi:MAG: hypothetical protein HC795_06830 [Coleofasciculaceae cyanobacterium RL_1_1]|nr:hypothetical protein [Coleofasciculaceae cyanobacterium RL_1_1]